MKTTILRYSFLAMAMLLASCQSTSGGKKSPAQKGKTLDTPPAESQFLPTAPSGEQPTSSPTADNGAAPTTTDPNKPADATGTTPAVDPTPAKPEPPKTVDTPPATTTPAATTPTTPPAPATTGNKLPYGKPVPGHKGFVTSPYDGSAGMIDVRDIAPGTKVRDPYTSKIFLVP
jgi:hypothetical protein